MKKTRYTEEQIIDAIKEHKLKKHLADKLLEAEAMKDVLSKKW